MTNLCFDSNVDTLLRAAQAATGQLDENFGEILCWPDNLTIGSLFPFDPQSRYAEIGEIGGISYSEFEGLWTRFNTQASSIANKPIIWTTDTTHEHLALCYACTLLNCQQVKVNVFDRAFHESLDWDNLLPIIPKETRIINCQPYASQWIDMLTAEKNNPKAERRLRIYKEGRIASVSEDYYDCFIRTYIKNNTFNDDACAILPVLVTEEIERTSGNLIVPEFFSVRLCRILGYHDNPWYPSIKIN